VRSDIREIARFLKARGWPDGHDEKRELLKLAADSVSEDQPSTRESESANRNLVCDEAIVEFSII